jgi:hypothetical protein
MKLLVTFSIFLCSLFVREPVFVNASAVAGNWMTTSTNDSSNAKEKSVSALQINYGFDEISLFDDDDDDDNEFSVSRKKIQLLRSFNNSIELLLMQQTHKSVFNPGFDYNTHFLAGTKKCIFQRVIRV